MKNFRYWRKMTWTIVISGALLLIWVAAGGFPRPTIALALGVLGLLWLVWFLTVPLCRQGRGLHLRRWQYAHVPYKTPSSSQDVG
jgi:hypothetical protein